MYLYLNFIYIYFLSKDNKFMKEQTCIIPSSYTYEQKREIAFQIKPITLNMISEEMIKLIEIGENAHTLSPRSRIGNNIVDYFSFCQRLETKGKYDCNFYDFVANIEQFKKKKFIANMLTYYQNVKNKNKTKNEYTVLKEVYNICISAINIMRPLVCMEIYAKYKPKSVLNFCAGWGGSLVACAALNIPNYIGIEINRNLKEPYSNMIEFLKNHSKTKVDLFFQDALAIDYSKLNYDLVFTSPPYYFIEKYQENAIYKNKKEMDDLFYRPIFKKVYDSLERKGYFIINVCKEVYENILLDLFGEPYESYPYKKSKRQNDHNEIVYVWAKN
jgi:predicted RNA methylase